MPWDLLKFFNDFAASIADQEEVVATDHLVLVIRIFVHSDLLILFTHFELLHTL